MPNIKLKDGSGIEQTYTNIQSITVPLADGTGNMTYGVNAKMLPQQYSNQYWGLWNLGQLEDYDAIDAISTVPISSMTYMFAGISVIDLDNITINPSLEANTGLSLDYCIGGNSNNNSAKIISLPVINNFILSHASNLFAYTDWSDSTITPNEFIESIDGLSEYYYNAEGTKSTNGSPYLDGMFSYSNIEELDLSHLGHGGLN